MRVYREHTVLGFLIAAQLATWEAVQPPVLHQGNWQSCDHEERVLEHRVNGALKWELHLGPDNQFALYRERVDGENHEHNGRENLLAPNFRVYNERRTWNVLHLRITISPAGGSLENCMSYYVRIEKRG